MAHNFLHRLFTGSKGPPTSAGRGVSKTRPVSARGAVSGSRRAKPAAGRARVGPKTMQRSPARKGIQSTSIGLPKGSASGSVAAARKRTTKRFKTNLTRRDR